MNSIKTNFSAMTALQSLNMTNKAMVETQSRISTGLRVADAQDNAAYWSMATTLRSDNRSLAAVSDALGLGAATVDVAYTGMDKAIEVATEMKAKLVAAREPGVDRAKVQTEIDALQDSLRSIATSASFSGENYLKVDSAATGYTATETIVASFTRSGSTVSIGTISLTKADTILIDTSASATAAARGILASTRDATTGAKAATGTAAIASADGTAELDISGATFTDANLESAIQAVDVAIQEMATGGTKLGAAKARIDLQQDFVGALMDSLDRGIASLVDADMNEESTRLQALQVQQQLGIQSLSIANSSAQNILSLFR